MVGAGPAGLILARRLAQTSAAFELFERHDDVGGIWNIDAPGSPMYETAHFISSRTMSGFDGFPMPEQYPDYPDYQQLLAYIQAFADEFDLHRHVRFNTPVDRAALGSRRAVGAPVRHRRDPPLPLSDLRQRSELGTSRGELAGSVQRGSPPLGHLPVAG